MNESLLICLSIGALLLAQRYLELRRGRDLALLVLATALVGAIKLPYLIIWAPIAGLFLEADGSRAWRWPLGLMMMVNLIVAAAWYLHAHQLAAITGLSFGMTDKLFDPDVVFSASFVRVMASRLFKDILGPVGAAGAVAGSGTACASGAGARCSASQGSARISCWSPAATISTTTISWR